MLRRLRAHRYRRSAFTLVEVMIVVAIIGILAAMALNSFIVARRNSRNVAFMNDISKASNAFELYAIENGSYPADKWPGVVPDGMAAYLPKMDWAEETPIGGQWDWDNGQFGFTAGVSVYKPGRSRAQMILVDGMLDDGDLGTGRFQERTDGYIYIIEF